MPGESWNDQPDQLFLLYELSPLVERRRMEWEAISTRVSQEGPYRSRDACRWRWRNKSPNDEIIISNSKFNEELFEAGDGLADVKFASVINILRKGPMPLSALADQLDRGTSTILDVLAEMKELGYGIESDDSYAVLPVKPKVPKPPPIIREPTTIVKFGVTADAHFTSKWEQPTNLAAWVDDIYDEGVRHMLFAGDMHAGRGVYSGQEHEVYAYTAPTQVEAASIRLPRKPGLTWYVLGGNHDYSFWKLSGLDVIAMLAAKRSDVVPLGYGAADLPLLPGMDVRLWHPRGGPAYAISYHPQKYAERIAFDELRKVIFKEKPGPTVRWILAGHYHRTGIWPMGAMWTMLAGCWEGQTIYLKEKGYIPEIGGALVECEIHDGAITRIAWDFRAYSEIEDDYKNYPIPLSKPYQARMSNPIFRLVEEKT